MRAVAATLVVTATFGLVVGLLACFDIFHSTNDVVTACTIDAHTAGCPDGAPASTYSGVDFCAWTSDEARAHAERACLWLGACETPLGRNQFSQCMFQALLTYDCRANPNHPARGKEHDQWACLASASSCGAVDACIFPTGTQSCTAGFDYVKCGTGGDSTSNDFDVRVECNDGGLAKGESCALRGQTCALDSNGNGVCAGARLDGGTCTARECDGLQIHFCDMGYDEGIDCSQNGAGRCTGFPPTGASWVACVPSGDAAACDADDTATCTNGVASSCAGGLPETLDCASLLGTTSACVPGPLDMGWDWTSPCQVVVPGDAGADAAPDLAACGDDLCTGFNVTSCVHGASFTGDCHAAGLGVCVITPTDQGHEQHARCTPPAGP